MPPQAPLLLTFFTLQLGFFDSLEKLRACLRTAFQIKMHIKARRTPRNFQGAWMHLSTQLCTQRTRSIVPPHSSTSMGMFIYTPPKCHSTASVYELELPAGRSMLMVVLASSFLARALPS